MKKFLVLFCLSVFVASSLAQELPEDIAQQLPEDIAQQLPEDIAQQLPEDIEQQLPEDIEQQLQDDRVGEDLDLSMDSQESEESADDRELGKRGGSALPPPVKKAAPPKKIVYRAAPKKTAPIPRPAPKQVASVTYLPSAPKKTVPRKLQEVADDLEELSGEAEESAQHPDEDIEEESVGERALGGNKRGGAPIPVKAPQPKKVAAPVYLGKKGGFYGSGYYRRLSEAPELSEEGADSEEQDIEPEASSEERELGKRGGAAPIPVKAAPPVHKKIVRPAPKKVIRPAPKKIVRAEPKKIVRPAPKKVVRPAPKKVIPASSKKGNYYRRLQEAEDEVSAFSELQEENEFEGAEHDHGEGEDAELREDLESEIPELTEDDTAGDAEDGSAEDRSLGGRKRGGDVPVPLPKKLPPAKKLPAPKKIYSSKPIVYRYSKKL
ncbi:conserved hypothetical protein [Neospora caninum Liverpool]|uniref:Uncharacterized protein n=1 Tax=Neospora caninum (strain Liverpool) TaxID=572307 RepID=F0VA15_NEOCL|nr:conserved hypothetical protein [Neospora caninum Liverpool]CBZ50504.1 conserved hypothetical protein [Neospora caninum Liverpool]CEL65114.1 TPA: hypothetical protein BN1204_009730 [Neospora caninum Liverpool]|eukprot:XP_003880537.1 conserved hypothetical protein [Neospora caninum Liverpool]